jgi:hypothetical protein
MKFEQVWFKFKSIWITLADMNGFKCPALWPGPHVGGAVSPTSTWALPPLARHLPPPPATRHAGWPNPPPIHASLNQTPPSPSISSPWSYPPHPLFQAARAQRPSPLLLPFQPHRRAPLPRVLVALKSDAVVGHRGPLPHSMSSTLSGVLLSIGPLLTLFPLPPSWQLTPRPLESTSSIRHRQTLLPEPGLPPHRWPVTTVHPHPHHLA